MKMGKEALDKLKQIEDDSIMSEQELMQAFEDIWPYKRVPVPGHILEEAAESLRKKYDEKELTVKQMYVTVEKGAELTDDLFRKLISVMQDAKSIDPSELDAKTSN